MKPILLFSLAAATCALATDLKLRAANWTVGQTVTTSSGPVSGHPATNDSDVSVYLGIPFGQAPVGDLRFAAPVAFKGTAPLNGTDFVSISTLIDIKISNELRYRDSPVLCLPARVLRLPLPN